MERLLLAAKVGFLLGARQIQRANIWLNILIITIMSLTFLNLVAVSGILVGLIVGSTEAYRQQFTGDVLVSELPDENVIEQTQPLLATLDTLPSVTAYSARYTAGASLEANYRTRRDFSVLPDQVSTSLVGIDPVDEDRVTNLSQYVIEGEYLRPEETGKILIGSVLLERFSPFSDLFEPLSGVFPGDKVKIKISGSSIDLINFNQLDTSPDDPNARIQEFEVAGIIDTKVDEVSTRVYITERDFLRLTGRTSLYANEIAVNHVDSTSDRQVKQALVSSGFSNFAKIQTAAEAVPRFLDQIKTTFGILGNVIGSIGIIVSVITIFVVIYINAITRRKFIGILKGIGIDGAAIRAAYMFQAFFYAVLGSGAGLFIVYALLQPYIAQNPIDFPFSDGILVAPLDETLFRMAMLMFVTVLAGFLPAWLIVRQNTLDSILGR